MPASIIKFEQARLASQAQSVAEALKAGKLVVLPTETVYGIAAIIDNPDAIKRLSQLKSRDGSHPFSLVVDSSEAARRIAIHWPGLAERLCQRICPGPITFVLEANKKAFEVWPPAAFDSCVLNSTVGVRIPDHPLTLEVLRQLGKPILLTSANFHGQPEAVTGQQAINNLGEEVDLICNAGQARYGKPSTVIKVSEKAIQILREGVLSPEDLKQLACRLVVIVCTGNTCRSPMAGVLFGQYLAKRIGCEIQDLADHGWRIETRGIAASPGMKASVNAISAMKKKKLDLTAHVSQLITEDLVTGADYIFTLTQGHLYSLLRQFPDAKGKAELLHPEGVDIPDPYGGSLEIYETCARQIENAVSLRTRQMNVE